MAETYPRRFIIRNRDDLAQILAEGVQWSLGGVSFVHHATPWVKDTDARRLALAEFQPLPVNLSELETLAASIWGELHWLDLTTEEIEAAAAKAQEEITAAWTQARAEMNEIFFGARRPWGEPIPVVEDENADSGPIVGDFSDARMAITLDSMVDEDVMEETIPTGLEEDSENKPDGRHLFAPGTVVYVDDEYHITSRHTGIPVGVIGEDGEIAQHGQVLGFVPSVALFREVAATDEDLKTLMAGLDDRKIEFTFERVDAEVFNILIGPVNCKHCGKPVKTVIRMGNTVWVHDDLGTSEYCEFKAEPDLPTHDEEPA